MNPTLSNNTVLFLKFQSRYAVAMEISLKITICFICNVGCVLDHCLHFTSLVAVI